VALMGSAAENWDLKAEGIVSFGFSWFRHFFIFLAL
jgi:hypothetical protein